MKNGVRCLDSQAYVEFSMVGDGRLIQNQGTSTGSRRVQAYNGRAYVNAVKNGKIAVCAHILSGELFEALNLSLYLPVSNLIN